jgi:cytochrome c oxidase assembly factor CtaG
VLAHAVSPSLTWSFEPLQVVPILVVAGAYGRRAWTLRRRRMPVPAWKQALFWAGIALLLVALVSPVDHLGEEDLFSFHMLQHILLGDLAPLALLAGLNGPLLAPVLRYLYRLRPLAYPLVALPLWAVDLYLWHLPVLYEAALHHDSVHALEHFCFFTAGALMWMSVLETLPAPEWFGTGWKLGYIAAVRVVGMVLGNVFIWSGTVFYSFYEHPQRVWGISALHDQSLGGILMMLEGSLVTFVALAWLFLRMASEGELRQQLLERGLDPRAVRRAVRYGRAEELTRPR